MALPHHAVLAPPAAAAAASASAPSSSAAPASWAFSAPAPSVAAESLRNTLVPRAALALPAAAPAASASAPPPSAAPAGRVFSAPAPPSLVGFHPVADKVPFISKASLAPPALMAPVSKPGLPVRSALRGIGTVATSICSNTSLADTNFYVIRGRSSKTMALQHRGAYGAPAASTPPGAPATRAFSAPPEELRTQEAPATRVFSAPAPSVALTKLLVPRAPLAPPPAAPAALVSATPPSAAPAGRVFPSPAPLHGQLHQHHIADKVVLTVTAEANQELDSNIRSDLLTTVAAHALPPPMVNLAFCGFKSRIEAIGVTVLDLVLLALLKQNIRIGVQDFYLMLNSKSIDGSVLVSSIPNLEESTITVCPRLRGGAPVQQPSWYDQLDVIINNNAGELLSHVQLPLGMIDPNCQHGGVANFLKRLPQFVLHQLLLLVCLEGHFEGHCYHGHFDLSKILMSSCGHVKFSPDVYDHEEDYTPEGGDADYQRLFSIVLTFLDLTTRRLPTHVASLLWVLRHAPESLRRKKEFIMFLVNHPSLLTFAEKHMLYNLINSFLITLLKTRNPDPSAQAEVDALKTWLQGTKVAGWGGWEQSVQNVPAFLKTYTRGAKCPKRARTSGLRVSVYKQGAEHCIRLSRNFLGHNYVQVGLMLAEAAVSYLLEFILPMVLYNLARCLSGANGKTFIGIVSNPRADRTTVTAYYPDDDDNDDDGDA
ncbi:unnamed protein product [Urochloa humidicola]